MTDYALVTLGLLVVLGVTATVVVRHLLRRLRGRAMSWTSQVYAMRTRFLPPGPRRDTALSRLRLEAELESTRELLENAGQGVVFRADAATVLRELACTAGQLDGELAAIERFPDADQQRSALAAVAPQVQQLVAAMYTARHTVLRTAIEDRSRRLAELQDVVATQAAALEVYRQERHQPGP